MLRNDYFTFGDVDSRSYAVGIYGDKLAEAPERDETFVSVPGRNGDLILDNGRYKNQTVPYKAYIIDKYNSNVKGLRNALLSQKGYQRLQDSINPEEFRLGKALPFDVDEYGILRAGEFTLQFNCKPQKFLTIGEEVITLTSNSSIYSDFVEEAKPLIRAYGTGSFSIGGVTIQITSANVYTDIDCDLEEAYKDSLATDCNANIVLTDDVFPTLKYGENQITMTGITKLEITPRWWIL